MVFRARGAIFHAKKLIFANTHYMVIPMRSHFLKLPGAAVLPVALLLAASSCTKDDPSDQPELPSLTLEALSTEELTYDFTYSQTIENEITHVALSKPDKLKGTAVVDILVKMRPMHGFDSEVNEATDYYLVTSTVSVQSGDMYKGNFTKKHGGVKARICGYYLKGLKSDICLTDTTGKEVGYLVQVPSPETLIGQKSYTTGWGLSIGGAVTAGTLPGITSKLGVTVSSKSSFEISDCDIVSRHKGCNVGYDYILNNLPTYNSKLKINPPPPSATSTVSFTSQWIWAVPTDDRDDATYYILKAKLSDLTYGASYFYSSKADYHDLTYKLADATYTQDITPPNRWPTGTVVLTNTEQDSYVSGIKFKSDHYNYDDGSSNYSHGKSFSVNLPVGEYSLSCTLKGANGQSNACHYESKVSVTTGDKVSLVSGKGFVTND